MTGMKTTDHTSARINITKAPDTRWYRVRPALFWTLASSLAAWLGVIGYEAARGVRSGELLESSARFIGQNGSIALDVLAAAAVVAVVAEGVRTSHRLCNLRRKLMRSLRVTHGSRTARA